MTGGQAVEMVKAGLQAIYLSGWQVAADANLSEQVYPDQSLYAANSVRPSCAASTTPCAGPTRSNGPRAAGARGPPHWMAPIVADAEAGFGGALNAFELMKA
jgi:isocitrate lyase